MANTSEGAKGTRIKACTECRQQKLRCDASKDYSKPCSRCRRFKLACVVSKDFKRVKRRTKTELQAELELLRKQVGTGTSEELQARPAEIYVSPPNAVALQPAITSTGAYATSQVPEASPQSLATATTFSRLQNSAEAYPSYPADKVSSTTRPQTIQDLTVDAQDIDGCFELFFTKNLRYLPIFDKRLNPNDCYSASPFLFWTIVVIGARRYNGDPTLILLLSSKVLELAKSAIFSTDKVLPAIQALVLLCTWQMPIDTLQKDITAQLSGAMIQLATNVGLHVYGAVQDFTRVPQKYDTKQRNFRARLWAICLYTSQRVNNARGLPPVMLMDTYSHQGYKDDPLAGLSPSVRFQRKLAQMQSEALLQIDREALSQKPEDRNVVLAPTINACLSRLASLNVECSSMVDQYLLLSSQLCVSACHLLAPSSMIGDVNLINMYTDACSMIELVTELDQEQEIAEYGSTNVNIMWNLAALIILRVGKSHVREALDLKRGQRCYFSTINLNKKQSVRPDDVSARATMILSQLWTSKMVLKQPDGTPDSLWLRCRNRLGCSLTYDSFWLWRQEFGGQPNSYDGIEDEKANSSGNPVSWTPSGSDSINMMGIGWSPDTVFQDFQWPIFDEFLYDGWVGSANQPDITQ